MLKYTLLLLSLSLNATFLYSVDKDKNSCIYDNFKNQKYKVKVTVTNKLPQTRDHAFFLSIVEKDKTSIYNFQENPKEQTNVYIVELKSKGVFGLCFENFMKKALRLKIEILDDHQINYLKNGAKNKSMHSLYKSVEMAYLMINYANEHVNQCFTRFVQLDLLEDKIKERINISMLITIGIAILIYIFQAIYIKVKVINKKMF